MSCKPTAPPPSDEQLARETQQGSVAGFEELVRRYQVPLLHFLRNHTGSVADAEDLVQDTFVRAYENLHRYRPSRRFSTWLFTIAHRIGLNEKRRKRPIAGPEALESVAAGAAEPETTAAEKEHRERLWDLAAEALSEEQWTAAWLYYVEEMSIREIARVLHRSRVATKTMLFRARKRLLPALQEMKPDGPVKKGQTPPERSPCRTALEVPNG